MREQLPATRERHLGPGGLDSLFHTPEEGSSLVAVSCGPYAEHLPVGRMTVGEIRTRFRDRFDIDARAIAVLDGHDVTDQTVVQSGQVLTFVQRAGEKGTHRTGGWWRV